MFLSEIFDQLTYGELTQLSAGGVHTEGILEQDYPKVISQINLGLTELHKRFDIKRSEVTVQQHDHIQLYFLNSKFAETNKPERVDDPDDPNNLKPVVPGISEYYIIDSPAYPFQDDVLRIERIFNELGEELYLNQDSPYTQHSNKYWSVHTPTYNSIQVPYPDNENQMIVTYRANHPRIPLVGTDPKTTEVDLPSSLLECLLLYIAARYNVNRGTELSLSEGQLFMTKFEMSCKKIEELNLMNSNDSFNTRFEMNGWV